MNRVLLTGATGFLGSNLAHGLIGSRYLVTGLHRNSSSFSKVKEIYDSINWINIDDSNWIKKINNSKFDILVHTAWSGVSLTERINWELQIKNFTISKTIFNTAINCGVKKILSLGSQAEYGIFNVPATEEFLPLPTDAYGAVKLLTMHYLRNLAIGLNVEWYWLRVFSVFGNGENSEWLIPTVINCLKNNKKIELSEGKQIYDYLFCDDFTKMILEIVNSNIDKTGVYNICSGRGIEIRNLLKKISQKFPSSNSLLEFGKIPYRSKQNMYIVGDNSKFEKNFGKIELEDLESSLLKTINSHISI